MKLSSLSELFLLEDDDASLQVMKCKYHPEHSPIRWDGLWNSSYSNPGERIVQWTCEECGCTFSDEFSDNKAEKFKQEFGKNEG